MDRLGARRVRRFHRLRPGAIHRQPKDGERMIELAARGLGVLDSESEYDS